MVAVGDRLPQFSARTQDGTSYSSVALAGRPAVVYFYPAADTPGCTIEAKGFRDALPRFRAQGVEVVGVSTDDCPAQKAFWDKYGLGFTLLADDSRAIAKQFGVLQPSGTAARVTFLVDADGRVAEIVKGPPADKHVAAASARFLKG